MTNKNGAPKTFGAPEQRVAKLGRGAETYSTGPFVLFLLKSNNKFNNKVSKKQDKRQ